MNPFANATILGYEPDEIISFLSKFSPDMGNKIQKAVTLGYSAEEIVKFLGKGFDVGGKKGKGKDSGPSYESALKLMSEKKPEAVKQSKNLRKQREQDVLSETLTRGLPAATGAGIGALAGGPAGALAGAAGGFTGADDLMSRYQKHLDEGGSLSMEDWVKSLLKGAAAGTAAYQAPKALAALQGMSQQEGASQLDQQAIPQLEHKGVSQAEPQSLAKRVMEDLNAQGVDFLKLPATRKNRINMLMDKLAELESQGKEYGNRSVQAVIKKIQKFAQGEGLNVREQETERFEARDKEEVIEAPKVLSQEELLEKKEPFQPKGHPDLQKYIQDIPTLDTSKAKKTIPTAKEIQALSSSNVSYLDYDPKTEKMQALFHPGSSKKAGAIYELDNIPESVADELFAGNAEAVTKGKGTGSMRAWFPGKDPSVGAAYNKLIKGKEEYNPRKIDPSEVNNKDLMQIRGADFVAQTGRYFEAFDNLVLKGKAKSGTKELRQKDLNNSLKDISNDIIDDIIFNVTRKVRDNVSAGKRAGKPVRYKGGRENYIDAEIAKGIEELKKRKKGGG